MIELKYLSKNPKWFSVDDIKAKDVKWTNKEVVYSVQLRDWIWFVSLQIQYWNYLVTFTFWSGMTKSREFHLSMEQVRESIKKWLVQLWFKEKEWIDDINSNFLDTNFDEDTFTEKKESNIKSVRDFSKFRKELTKEIVLEIIGKTSDKIPKPWIVVGSSERRYVGQYIPKSFLQIEILLSHW